jgi:phospholipid-binding lipoprotein MlaA
VKRLFFAAMLAAHVLLAGCATVDKPDPMETWNRKVFAFNEKVDDIAIKPVATAYKAVVPHPVRQAVTNFFNNMFDAWSAVNLFLQGRFEDGLNSTLRFGANSVFGFFGIADPATEMGLERKTEDFGQTLGKWGVPTGAYIVWPVLGPSTVRDSVALPVETQVSPETFLTGIAERNVLTALRLVNTRANLLQATSVLDDIALDKYTFVRDAYLQRRRSLVYDGDPPPLDSERDVSPGDKPGAKPPVKSTDQPAPK